MRNSGLTLIEFTIYIAIIGVISVLMIGFLWNIIFGNIKAVSYQEVQENARFALTKMTQEIKKAIEIYSPSVSDPPADSLTLTMADNSSTIFDVVEGKLRITQGNQGPYELTSDQVIVSNLNFTNLSYQDTPGTIRIEITIEHINSSNRVEYLASINLKSTVSLFQAGAAP